MASGVLRHRPIKRSAAILTTSTGTAAITLSVISHGQARLASQFLEDLGRHCATPVVLVLTHNVAEHEPFAIERQRVPAAEVIVNASPKGFGANHNSAFARCRTPFFCVANPDVRLAGDPFPVLLSALTDERVAVAGPLVRAPDGGVEDSARRFPTPGTLVSKLFGGRRGPDYPINRGNVPVDWIAGMFMLFRSEAFAAIRGFDERYFLYYEDADICRRLRAAEREVLYVPAAEVVHDARRASRRNPRLALHHAASAWRFIRGL